MTIELFIPAPLNNQLKPDWINANDRGHWSKRHKKTRKWRNITMWKARQHFLPKGLQRVAVMAYVHKTNAASYDAHNLMPTLKAIIDGLAEGKGKVRGYGLIPDDGNDHLTGPDIRPGERRDQAGITVVITPELP